jgi:hypothetical protein
MWWMLAGCGMAGLIGLEARRVLRARIADAKGPRHYALYMAGQPKRALRLMAIGAEGSRVEDAGAEAAGMPVPDGGGKLKNPSSRSVWSERVTDAGGPPQLRRHRRRSRN